jgi:uroporphyrinogen-III synthase
VKRILVLRAEEDAARTAAALRARGYEPLIAPVLETVATGARAPQGHYDALLATSAKGLAYATLDFAGPPVFVVGARTAAQAAACGLAVAAVAPDAAALLADVRARFTAPARFLYLAGQSRRDALESGLVDAGHSVVSVVTYEARAATALSPDASRALKDGALFAVLHYSRRSAQIFVDLAIAAGLAEAAARVAHIAISSDAATQLECIAARVEIAEAPDEDHLLLKLDACA